MPHFSQAPEPWHSFLNALDPEARQNPGTWQTRTDFFRRFSFASNDARHRIPPIISLTFHAKEFVHALS